MSHAHASGLLPPFLLHGIVSGGGYSDEIITYGALGALLVGLSLWPYVRRKIQKRRRGGERRPPRRG